MKTPQAGWMMLLVMLLLFKSVASAAMWCCGPAQTTGHGSSHQSFDYQPAQLTATPQSSPHCGMDGGMHGGMDGAEHALTSAQTVVTDSDTNLQSDSDSWSCAGCNSGCTAAVFCLSGWAQPGSPSVEPRIELYHPLHPHPQVSALERPPRSLS